MASVGTNYTWNGPEIEGLTVAAARAGTMGAATVLQNTIKANLSRPGTPTNRKTMIKQIEAANRLEKQESDFSRFADRFASAKFTGKNRGRAAKLFEKASRQVSRASTVAAHKGRGLLDKFASGSFVDLPGGMPRRRTGDLRRSIIVEPEPDSVLVGAASEYGAIHEFGGVIVPKTKKFLAFEIIPGVMRFAKRVVIPPRPYIRPSLNQAGPSMFEAFMANAKRVMGGG